MDAILYGLVVLIRRAEEYKDLAGWVQALVGAAALTGIWLTYRQLRSDNEMRRSNRKAMLVNAKNLAEFSQNFLLVQAMSLRRDSAKYIDDRAAGTFGIPIRAIEAFPIDRLDDPAAITALRRVLIYLHKGEMEVDQLCRREKPEEDTPRVIVVLEEASRRALEETAVLANIADKA